MAVKIEKVADGVMVSSGRSRMTVSEEDLTRLVGVGKFYLDHTKNGIVGVTMNDDGTGTFSGTVDALKKVMGDKLYLPDPHLPHPQQQ